MRPLFTSQVCDWCDGLDDITWERGYIVLRDGALLGQLETYVFESRTDAAVWRSVSGMPTCPIVEVLSELPFRWTVTSGSVRGLTVANKLVTIYADRRYPPGTNRAFIAHPEHRNAA